MKENLRETDSLQTLFGAVVEVLERREEILLERITALEQKVEQLEMTIAGFQEKPVKEEEVVVYPQADDEGDELDFQLDDSEFDAMPDEEEGFQLQEEFEEEFGQEKPGQPQEQPVLMVDKVRPDWYDWEVDIPGDYIEDIRDGIGLNDRILFLNELFGGNMEDFERAIDDLNGMRNLVETVEYLRDRFPQWDEESDEVYRFYMTVRRRFNKQKQEG